MSKPQPLVHVRKVRPDGIADILHMLIGYRWRVTCDACLTLDPAPSRTLTFKQAIAVATGHARSAEHHRRVFLRAALTGTLRPAIKGAARA